jgi:hypothetical protein
MRSNQKILMRNEDSMNMFLNQGQSVPTRKEGVSSNQYGRQVNEESMRELYRYR